MTLSHRRGEHQPAAALPPLPPALAAQGIGLRPQEADDRPFLRLLYGLGRAAELAAVPWPGAVREAFLDDQFRLQSSHLARTCPAADMLVVTRQDAGMSRPVGRLALDRSGPRWRLMEVALLPHLHGRGLGTALIGWVQAAAVAARATGIDLQVLHDNPRAAALYARLGFRPRPGGTATHQPMRWQAGAGR